MGNKYIQDKKTGQLKGSYPQKVSPTSMPTHTPPLPIETEEPPTMNDTLNRMLNIVENTIPPLPQEGEPTRIIFLRGLPASGKTTWAKKVIDHHPAGAVARLNNDDLSRAMFGSMRSEGLADGAKLFRSLRATALQALLADKNIRMIIVDNTNLSVRTINELASKAELAGAQVEVDDRFLRIPLEECLRRNSLREEPVPDEVIRRMHKQASSLKSWRREPFRIVPYPNDDERLPETVIIDVDGTLAIMNDRRAYDWHRVAEDTPNVSVVRTVQDMVAAGRHVVIMSGRDGSCREDTENWIAEHVGVRLPLHMRAAGDNRPDYVVKHEMFHNHIAGNYRVSHVIDDRDSVVDLWRKMGLPCWQVAEGDF